MLRAVRCAREQDIARDVHISLKEPCKTRLSKTIYTVTILAIASHAVAAATIIGADRVSPDPVLAAVTVHRGKTAGTISPHPETILAKAGHAVAAATIIGAEDAAVIGADRVPPDPVLAAVTVHRRKGVGTKSHHTHTILANPDHAVAAAIIGAEDTAVLGADGVAPDAVLPAVTVHRCKTVDTISPHAHSILAKASYTVADGVICASKASNTCSLGIAFIWIHCPAPSVSLDFPLKVIVITSARTVCPTAVMRIPLREVGRVYEKA